MRTLAATTALAAVLCAATPAHALVTAWTAASGLLPTAVDPGWTLVNTMPAGPSLSGDVLTIATSSNFNENQFYQMSGASFAAPATGPYWLEAEVRFVSGSQLAGWWRAPVFMSFRFDNGSTAVLEIRQDLIFIRNGNNSVGASNASVDTNDAFHTYRLEALGTAAGSTVNVYQNGVLVLSDNALFNAGVAGQGSVSWGEASTLALGVSEWKSVSHNMAAVASPVPEPTAAGLLAAGLLAMTVCTRRRRSA